MKNLWDKSEGLKYIKHYKKYNVSNDLALRIYTTHLLGGEKKLVLHGGGNTSVKTNYKNIFGEINKVIYVKGSGWDMSNLTHEGMPGLNINPLLKTLSLISFIVLAITKNKVLQSCPMVVQTLF